MDLAHRRAGIPGHNAGLPVLLSTSNKWEARYGNDLLVTCEILTVVIMPLFALYITGNWPVRKVIPPLVIIPVLWYLTYAPPHELSHILGTCLAGGKGVDYRLIPRFWMGELSGAWIKTIGLVHHWQNLTMLSAPYPLYATAVMTDVVVLRRRLPKHAFWVGLLFMLLCLRPAFDLTSEKIGFCRSFRGDLYKIQLTVGGAILS